MISKRVIVVGKNSVIGRCYCQHAQEEKYNFQGLSSAECNFMDAQMVEDFFKMQGDSECAVVFFAAVNKRVKNDYEAFVNNTQMIQNLMRGVRYANVSSVVYLSATDVYGEAPKLPITEQNAIKPESYYSLAKASCEWMLLSSGEMNCPATVLRIPGAYGMPEDVHGAIGKFIRKVLKGEKISLTNSGETLRDYVEVEDLCRVIDLAIQKSYRGAVNVVTGESASLKKIIQVIEEITSKKAKVNLDKAVTERDFNLVFDVGLFRNIFSSFQFTDLEEGIRKYVQIEKEALKV